MADLSGATVGDFQESNAGFTPAGDVQADITKHDANTFAGLTAQAALKTLYAQGLQPNSEVITGIFNKALEDANNYHKTLAEGQAAANLELQKRSAAVQSGVLAAEKATEANVDLAKQEQLEQWKQTGEIKAPDQADIDRVNGFEGGYQTASKLQDYHTAMVNNTLGAGGFIKEHLLGAIADVTSPQTIDFNRYKESSITPLARGVMGDKGASATKDVIMENIKDFLIGKGDNIDTAGRTTYMLKDRIMQNLITDRNNAVAAHKDPALWDAAIGRLSANFNSQDVRQYAPNFAKNTPLVQNGVSTPGTVNLNTHLIATVQNQQNQQGQSQLGNPFPASSPSPSASPLPSPSASPRPSASPLPANQFSAVQPNTLPTVFAGQ